MKKIFIALFTILMIIAITPNAVFAVDKNNYQETNTDNKDLYYTVYNENGQIVEEGIIPADGKRHHWDPNITLENGWYTSFTLEGGNAFWATDGTSMTLSYTLNRSAKIKWQIRKCSSRSVSTGANWKSGTKTAKSGTIVRTADSSKWYYPGITNSSSDPITIKSVDFEW